MHCLGAGMGGQSSPNGFGAQGSVLNVIRALGVLVSEGRIQGGPRGYKEGPHCVAPLQPAPNDHVCEKDNCLCDRYLVLVREITDLIDSGLYLCIEVVLCSDCPCGLIKSKSKHRVLASCSSQTSWQQTSEMLLEYWCIGVVPSKCPETMNSQGLYQAVRSRLHFSQVAAWWSKTNGTKPSYVATRILQHPINIEEHLRRFRESPIEHTFPLAGVGDGNSLKVTMWALPRMEETPILQCPKHPIPLTSETTSAETSCPRAATPTKLLIPTDGVVNAEGSTSPGESGEVIDGLLVPEPQPTPGPTTANIINQSTTTPTSATDTNFVYYMSSFRSAALLDVCQQPGKHNCRCADAEDGTTGAPPRAERKRRRSLPCGPPASPQQTPPTSGPPVTEPLPALNEQAPIELEGLARSFSSQLSLSTTPNRSEKRLKRSHTQDQSAVPSGRRESKPLRPMRPNPLLRPDAKSTGSALDGLASALSLGDRPAGVLDWICARPALTEPAARRINNLELSPREFDEVLAVLRAHTPHGSRRRSGLRATAKRRSEKTEPSPPQPPPPQPRNKADLLLGAILRSSSREPTGSSSEGSADTDEPGLPSSIDKRALRTKQLGKGVESRSQSPAETRVKRRINFSEGPDDEADDEGEDEDEEEEVEEPKLKSEQVKAKEREVEVNHNNNNVIPSEDENDRNIVPSAKDQERFRRSLENAASMVFHNRTGLPLTSSPAPLRRGSCCFDFDSTLNSVSSKRSALFELNTPPSPGAVSLEEGDKEAENVCDNGEVVRRRSTSRNRPQSHALLGSFEESALNGRLEPVSTVHGFTAEIGASGSFCPKHRKLPVTVFFYTLGDNDKVSSPYLAHINLGKKGYQVPRMGTIQVTLLNPLGTVVKMFVVLYDLTDMPPRSHTFLRQRTLRDKTLRYLIHLRFMSGKSGRIYLHTDVRMIICRKSDVDTASDFGSEPPKELRSYIHGPTNPKFSPRF